MITFRMGCALRVAAVTSLVAIVAAWLIIPQLVESAYEGTSWPFLNNLISGQHERSLQDYLYVTSRYMLALSVAGVTTSALAIALSIQTVRERLFMIVSSRDVIAESYTLVSISIMLIAVALRFFQLGGASLWFDEAVYANNSMTDFWSFIENTHQSNSSPILLPYLYYIFGESLRDPFLIRIPPAMFSVLSVAVMLALPRAGVSFSVAALSAFILAIAPAQIEYAQEVREYSLSVFASCMIIFTFAFALNKHSKRSLIYFSLVLVATPFASYGTIFLALAAVVAFVFIEVSGQRYKRGILLIPVISLLIGIALTYQLTAMHQMRIAKSWYLSGHYPPDAIIPVLKWLVSSGLAYFRQAVGGLELGLLSLLLVCFHMVTSAGLRGNWRAKPNFFLVLLILFGGSIVAASIGVYPFGGIRQHLFATPLIVLCVAQSVIALGSVFGQKGTTMAVIAFSLLVSFNSLIAVPRAYAEKEDIVSAVSEGLEGIPHSNVYAYYAARHALEFHYPDHQFYAGKPARGDIDIIGEEIVSLVEEKSVYVLFSHVFKDEDDQILDYLADDGLTLIEDKKYRGARVVKLSRSAD